MSSETPTDDTLSISEYRDKFSGWRANVMYLALVTYGMTFAAGLYIVNETMISETVLIGILIAAFGCGILAPVAMWKDVTLVREETIWNPSRYRYVVGSMLVGLPGLLVLLFYIVMRRDAIQKTEAEL